jgi:hypothetical protein
MSDSGILHTSKLSETMPTSFQKPQHHVRYYSKLILVNIIFLTLFLFSIMTHWPNFGWIRKCINIALLYHSGTRTLVPLQLMCMGEHVSEQQIDQMIDPLILTSIGVGFNYNLYV